jgi:hypothetical protein
MADDGGAFQGGSDQSTSHCFNLLVRKLLKIDPDQGLCNLCPVKKSLSSLTEDVHCPFMNEESEESRWSEIFRPSCLR